VCWISYSVKLIRQSTNPCSGVNLRTVTQEDTNYICLVGPGSQVKRRFTPDCWHIGACIMLQQVYDDIHTAHEAGHM